MSVVIDLFDVLDVAKVKDLYDLKRNNRVFDLKRSFSLYLVFFFFFFTIEQVIV